MRGIDFPSKIVAYLYLKDFLVLLILWFLPPGNKVDSRQKESTYSNSEQATQRPGAVFSEPNNWTHDPKKNVFSIPGVGDNQEMQLGYWKIGILGYFDNVQEQQNKVFNQNWPEKPKKCFGIDNLIFPS